MAIRGTGSLPPQPIQRINSSEQSQRASAPTPPLGQAESAAQESAQPAVSTTHRENQNQVDTARRQATFNPNIEGLFDQQFGTGALMPDPIDIIPDLVNVAVYPGSDKIAKGNLSAFQDLLGDMTPEQLEEARNFLQNEIANRDPERLGGYSLAPEMLKMLDAQVDSTQQTEGQGRIEESPDTEPAPDTNEQGTGLLRDPGEEVRELVNVPVIPETPQITKENLAAFQALLNDMTPEQLEVTKDYLQREVDHHDPMLLGSASLAPEMLKMLNAHTDSMNQTEDQSGIQQVSDAEPFDESNFGTGLRTPPPIEGLEDMISITTYRDGGQTQRATQKKFQSLANEMSPAELRQTQQWLLEQIQDYRQSTPPEGQTFLAPRFLSSINSLISAMEPAEAP